VGLLPSTAATDAEPQAVSMRRLRSLDVLASSEVPRALGRGQAVSRRATSIAWTAFWITWAIALGITVERLIVAMLG